MDSTLKTQDSKLTSKLVRAGSTAAADKQGGVSVLLQRRSVVICGRTVRACSRASVSPGSESFTDRCVRLVRFPRRPKLQSTARGGEGRGGEGGDIQ